jgi:hypothetical protein
LATLRPSVAALSGALADFSITVGHVDAPPRG